MKKGHGSGRSDAQNAHHRCSPALNTGSLWCWRGWRPAGALAANLAPRQCGGIAPGAFPGAGGYVVDEAFESHPPGSAHTTSLAYYG